MTWNIVIKPAKTRRDLYIMESGGDEGDEDVDGGNCSSSEVSECCVVLYWESSNWDIVVGVDMVNRMERSVWRGIEERYKV